MAVDKLVDSTQLDSDLNNVANAILDKSGGTGPIAFPSGFISEIQAIPSGGPGEWTTDQIATSAAPSGDITITGNISSYGLAYRPEIISIDAKNLTTAGSYAAYKSTNITNIVIKATSNITISDHAFSYCNKLETIDFASDVKVSLNSYAFEFTYNLTHLILRSSVLCPLGNVQALRQTNIARKIGAIYVPSNLVNSYKTASNWATYADMIHSISEYPITDFSTISDSWSDIISNSNYATDYSVGDIKKIEIDNQIHYMQIVGFDVDTLSSDNTSKAHISWISLNAIANSRQMNTSRTVTNGWAEMPLRTWLRETILPTLPDIVKNNIKAVNKTYRTKSPSDTTLTISDTIWIPSYKEINLTSSTYVESSGVVYSSIFTSTADTRVKTNVLNNNTVEWWTRSSGSTTQFVVSTNSGVGQAKWPDQQYAVVIGFCT